ncbi:two-component system, chemotaxis family, response regulator CheB [Thermosyntropha lipolytica DSM 11003]|uniref:Protein-glutamate methylesterase/protein-glutamine glutaminase n=1 Tax=Thermosyntropha lipolytica DSM 11003 TaxID=1123382 RepID=A0A1M5KY09_9FIRM|nr:chemotaxis response regulator protein-glutamate methylesterase [Thermosyntropha lipolytica]SHG57616.1 two-component system, chemotaxis family, response regulator CheB [Thermosyntropha lipolytica DSM 11003]
MKKIRVLVVDDSAFMRKVISDIINNEPDLEVVDKARDGLEAVAKVKELKPDVVTMDVEMPGLDGLTALERIMKECPTPVVMLSSVTKSGAEQTLKALQLGAVDFVTKPSGQISLDINKVREDIVRKIKIAAGTKKNLANLNNIIQAPERKGFFSKDKLTDYSKSLHKLVIIGTSTGGPKALHQVIPKLPASIDAGILIVQHMPPGFTRSLAERLDAVSEIKVKEAEAGEKIVPGCAYIAPGDHHLCVEARGSGGNRELFIVTDRNIPPRGGLRPAVDVTLESVARNYWGHIVAVIMTGMGHDGAAGLPLIKEKGGKIIAEHESTCIVYGMPKAAVETGKVDKIVPLYHISEEIVKML